MSQVDQSSVALVTGGAQGIGLGVSQFLLHQGWRVAIADVNEAAGAVLPKTLSQFGESFLFVPCDVTQESDVERCIAATLDRFGHLNALVNNAGIAHPYSGPVEDLELADWNRWIGTNLTGYFLMVKHAVRHLRATQGAIVNIASVRALQSEPDSEAYAASKGGIVALTHALAMSLGPAIRVNCISPGWIDVNALKHPPQESHFSSTDHSQHPVGRVGQAQDIAEMAYFLLSEKASFITGQNIVVDGGMGRKMIYEE